VSLSAAVKEPVYAEMRAAAANSALKRVCDVMALVDSEGSDSARAKGTGDGSQSRLKLRLKARSRSSLLASRSQGRLQKLVTSLQPRASGEHPRLQQQYQQPPQQSSSGKKSSCKSSEREHDDAHIVMMKVLQAQLP